MDEATRRLERAVRSGGDGEARLRLGESYLRGGRYADALAMVDGLEEAEARVLAAQAALRLGRPDAALAAAAQAAERASASVPTGLALELVERTLPKAPRELEGLTRLRRVAGLGDVVAPALRRFLGDPQLLVRAQLARVPALRPALLGDPSPCVRHLARGLPRRPGYPREPTPTRLFSAHGPDFEIGNCVAFVSSCEERLQLFDAELFAAVDLLLGPGKRTTAMGLGYGLAVPSRAPLGELPQRVEAVNAADVLPFTLEFSRGQPFDALTGRDAEDGAGLSRRDEHLAWRFARDLAQHPARNREVPSEDLYARVLGLFHPDEAHDEGALAKLLAEAPRHYGPVGVRALELFCAHALEPPAQRRQRFRRDRV